MMRLPKQIETANDVQLFFFVKEHEFIGRFLFPIWVKDLFLVKFFMLMLKLNLRLRLLESLPPWSSVVSVSLTRLDYLALAVARHTSERLTPSLVGHFMS